jgi:hypothetical protein
MEQTSIGPLNDLLWRGQAIAGAKEEPVARNQDRTYKEITGQERSVRSQLFGQAAGSVTLMSNTEDGRCFAELPTILGYLFVLSIVWMERGTSGGTTGEMHGPALSKMCLILQVLTK